MINLTFPPRHPWAVLFLFSSVALTGAFAQEALGPTYTIVEPDMLKAIDTHLREKERSGELARMEREIIARAKSKLENPNPVMGLSKAERNHTFFYDPSVTVPETIKDHSGHIVVAAGTRVNPLDYVSLSRHLLFFDGGDQAQVVKAFQLIGYYNGLVKPILTNGPIGEIARKWQQPVYFDQGGTLVRKLGITHVPSLVSQDGKRLRIDELLVETR